MTPWAASSPRRHADPLHLRRRRQPHQRTTAAGTVQYAFDTLNRIRHSQPHRHHLRSRRRPDPVCLRRRPPRGVTTYANDRLLAETLSGVRTQNTYDNNGNTLSKVENATDQAFYHGDTENRLVAADVRVLELIANRPDVPIDPGCGQRVRRASARASISLGCTIGPRKVCCTSCIETTA